MNREHWARLKDVFAAVVEQPSAQRQSALDNICQGDADLRAEVLDLLNHYQEASRFLTSLGAKSIKNLLGTGDFLAARYRIITFLGSGGMAEVYEAEDCELGGSVALKVIYPHLCAEKASLDRFRREVHLARQVTHPNVCRVFDIGHGHQREREIVFLTMELICGETLAARLKRLGRLLPSEALPLALQLCQGLGAAHDAGVLHRDFKPANVLLFESQGQIRASITDFGIARALGAGDAWNVQPTASGVVLGTPAYMSPEQLVGKPLTPAADIYSVGLVLYEMITGVKPFGESAWMNVMRRLTEDSAEPVQHVPALDPQWNYAIRRCLRREPGERFRSASEIVAHLTQQSTKYQDTEPPIAIASEIEKNSDFTILRDLECDRAKRFASTPEVSDSLRRIAGIEDATNPGAQVKFRPRSKPWIWASLAVLIAVVASLFLMVFRAYPVRALTAKDVVVLADFTNNTGEPVFDGTLKEALAIDLEQSPFLNILSDVSVVRTLKLMGRSSSERLTPEIAREICLRSNSHALIGGSIARLGSHYVLHLKATNCQTGDLLGTAEAEADSRENTLQALGRAATVLRSKVGESLTSVQKFNKPLEEVTTSSLDALKVYSEGLRAKASGDPEAIPFLLRAVKLDPNFAQAYADLGLSYSDIRERGLSIENLLKAYELRERVSEREQYLITALYYRVVTGELSKGLQQDRLLVQEYPNYAFGHFDLGTAHLMLGQYEDAARSVRETLRLDPIAGLGSAVLAYEYNALHRLDEAQAVLNGALSQTPDQPMVHFNLYALAFARDDQAAMQQQIAWAKGKLWAEGMLFALESASQAFHGRLRKALELNDQAFEADRQMISIEAAADLEAVDAIRFAGFGFVQEARNAAHRSLTHGVSFRTTILSLPGNGFAVAALALIRAGDAPGAKAAARTLTQKAPLNTLIQNFWLPTIQAEMEINNGHPAKAIKLLRATTPYDFIDVGAMASVYTRGRAFLALGDGAAAAQEFQKVLDRSRLHWYRFPGSVAYLGLARAHVLLSRSEKGSAAETAKAQARTAYQNFFELWKDADPDIPILRQAQKEYAKIISN